MPASARRDAWPLRAAVVLPEDHLGQAGCRDGADHLDDDEPGRDPAELRGAEQARRERDDEQHPEALQGRAAET